MQGDIVGIIGVCIVLLLADWYITSGLGGALRKWPLTRRKLALSAYWIISITLLIALFVALYASIHVGQRAAILFIFFVLFIAKICFIPFIVADDIRRLVVFLKKPKAKPHPPESKKENAIPRSEFLLKAGIIAAAVPLATLTYGITTGVYDYRIKRHKLYLPNLPKAFDGLKLGQISDIHSGSFYNKKAVQGGVDMLMREKPDLIFFTGDLVNDQSDEMYGYQDIFGKVKAPLGVFSTLGNHDYGDYAWWPTPEAKKKNLQDLKNIHKNLGWQLLCNENRRLKVGGEEIGILGMENWGTLSRFPKYGNMGLTVKNTDDLPVKLLLSHDPSHWRAEVLPKYPQIDMVFAGHTHGMQFGIRTKEFQWSPVEYIYKEWAGFYNEGHQQIYVNVGYGFLGYTGRVGILPEITIFELKAGTNPALGNS